jgi:hypothetical protein
LNRHAELKQHHRDIREQQPLNLSLRIHRSLSWLDRAEQSDDPDSQVIFLWIAFNAAYASEIGPNKQVTESSRFRKFFKKLCSLDANNQLYNIVWEEFPNSIRLLLDNKYVNKDFWEYQRGEISDETWTRKAANNKKAISAALGSQNTPDTLSIIFSRIYVLRNQLIHGGSTWGSSMNRDQIRDCVHFMEKFIPTMLEVMFLGDSVEWDQPSFPPIRD